MVRAAKSGCWKQAFLHRPARALTVLLLVGLLGGCASVMNPVANGVPVRRVPPVLLGTSRATLVQVPLNRLRQPPAEVYRLESGDVLGIYIEGVLGNANQPPPVRLVEQSSLPPAMGYPVPVRQDGTLSLPFVAPVRVEGMTVVEAEKAVREAYTVTKQILKPGRERIIVTLLQPRTYSVLVVRQDSGPGTGATTPVSFGSFVGGAEVVGPRKRGTGNNLELPAYENDLLNALTRSGGLPGLDAKNEVFIFRGANKGGAEAMAAAQLLQQCPNPAGAGGAFGGAGVQVIRIPLRLPPGAEVPFRPEDIILKSGDIVFVPARDTEVFYTGGLLIPGQYPLPRDYDLRAVQAISLVRGTLMNGGINANNFQGILQNGGIGFPNPTQLSIIRRVPSGGQFTIMVNLNRALQDERENIILQPDDILILQNTLGEALTQYFVQPQNFAINLLGTPIMRGSLTGQTNLFFP